MSNESIAKKIKSQLTQVFGTRFKSIILFGSQARGESKIDSDIDILLLLDAVSDLGSDLYKALEAVNHLSIELGRRISIKPVDTDVYNKGDCPLFRNIKREGIIA